MSEFTVKPGDEVKIRYTEWTPSKEFTRTASGTVLAAICENDKGIVTEIAVRLEGSRQNSRDPEAYEWRDIVRVGPDAVRALIVCDEDEDERCHICGTCVPDPNRSLCSACGEVRAHVIGRPMIARAILRALDDERLTEPVTEVKVGLTETAF